jgi:G6PDH family F420-dependent oxidoreductase
VKTTVRPAIAVAMNAYWVVEDVLECPTETAHRLVPFREFCCGYQRVMRLGYFLSCEEYAPADLLDQARYAADAGFEALWISDHYHPWLRSQGQSPFVWSMIGALSQAVQLPITTAVTCPTVRIHPAVIAQAAATSAVLTGGRFTLGVGTGEAINEHITGQVWPSARVRREMLAEAVKIMRALWTGEVVYHRGRHYTVDHARLYTLPDAPPPVFVSGLGPASTRLAAEIGDGYISTKLDSALVSLFRDAGGGSKVVAAGMKGCWAKTEAQAVEIAHKLWTNEGLPGELSRMLPYPEHFEQAAAVVPWEAMKMPHGPDSQPYIDAIDTYRRAGFDELYIAAVGPHHREFIEMFTHEVIPHM